MDRYIRNEKMLTKEENLILRTKTVAIIGCGGLGGYIIEMLGRLGVGTLKVVDKDVFEESNLNRQILSDTINIGQHKAEAALERMKLINPDIKVLSYITNFDSISGEEILQNCDVVIDALDSIESRLILESYCEKMNIPLVHGAITGWYGQISTIFPGNRTLNKFYNNKPEKENTLGNPSFTPALVGAIQVSETLKLLIGRGNVLKNKIMFINLYDNDIEIIDI